MPSSFTASAERLDQPRPETALLRSLNRRAVPLSHFQMQTLRLRIKRPGDVDAAGRHRQCAELRGIGAEFVEGPRLVEWSPLAILPRAD